MRKILLLSTVMMFFAFTVMAQKTVTGVVSDDSGIPLPGATIVEQNTSNGVSSDFDGNFAINIAQGAVLIIAIIIIVVFYLLANENHSRRIGWYLV